MLGNNRGMQAVGVFDRAYLGLLTGRQTGRLGCLGSTHGLLERIFAEPCVNATCQRYYSGSPEAFFQDVRVYDAES